MDLKKYKGKWLDYNVNSFILISIRMQLFIEMLFIFALCSYFLYKRIFKFTKQAYLCTIV